MIEHKHVQISIAIVVKESSLCSKANQIEAKLHGPVNKFRHSIFVIAFIYKKLIFTFEDEIVAKVAYIYIKLAVVVNVGHRNTCGPPFKTCYARRFRNVLKL